jgi:diguanylate cyclase (GGDEF)-like protein
VREEAVVGVPTVETPSRARLATLLVLVALVPLLALAWLAATGVGRSQTRTTDVRLESEGRAASAMFVGSVAAAASRAKSLASSQTLQQALATRDRASLRRLVGPDDVVAAVGGEVLTGAPVALAVRRSVSVIVGGHSIGSVTVNVPLNGALLTRLGAGVGLDARDRLALVRGGRAIAGAIVGPAAVSLDGPVDRTLDGTKYRVFATRLVGPPDSVELLALTPRSAIGGGFRDHLFWTLLAIVVTLGTVAAAGYALAPLLARRVGGPLAVISGRRDARALALVGAALASTHNPDKLLPVILHATMDATGAVGGRVLQDGRVIAEEGDVAGAGSPLRLELGGEDGAEEIALQLWPAGGGFDNRTRTLAQSLAAQAAIALENARLHVIVQRQAITDELTELANRRYFMETLETELRRAERFDEPLALVFADIDDFKNVNDRHGHHVGDSVLRAFADVLRGRIRAIDLAARLGGEEFAIILIETDLKGAEALAESLRSAVAAVEVRVVGSEPVRITASFGVADYPQTRGAGELMAVADRALYKAKREGKNRVSVAPDSPF